MIVYLTILLLKNSFNVEELIYLLKHIFFINTDGLPIAGALWFLTSLFFVYIIYYFVSKIKAELQKNILVIILVCIGYIVPKYFRLPFALDTALVGIGLFHLGSLFKRYYTMRNINLLYGLLSLVIGSIFVFYNGYVNIRQGIYSNIILFFITAVLITFGLFIISSKLKKWHLKIIQEIKFIGSHSIIYVCLNQFILLILCKFTYYCKNIFALSIMNLIILIFSIATLHFVVILFENKQIKWILGK